MISIRPGYILTKDTTYTIRNHRSMHYNDKNYKQYRRKIIRQITQNKAQKGILTSNRTFRTYISQYFRKSARHNHNKFKRTLYTHRQHFLTSEHSPTNPLTKHKYSEFQLRANMNNERQIIISKDSGLWYIVPALNDFSLRFEFNEP